MEQSTVLAWLEAIPSSLWSLVRWVAFFFKLASLAFIVPTVGLIAFDFSVWLWRLYRPSAPADSRSSRPPKDHRRQPPVGSTRAPSTAIDLETEPQATERRAVYENTYG
ncbi:hypothetical protein SAMD00023353_2501270 [Rosellinia necatrix]|uniref:Uncharacterized protein n=1 Tax=Rosellinia necatrix TaxID=77044 RepID=A0A1S8A960_ROSNE|nr:hypothetical protein SAMD00023353_2501270 [Rosellinia necatrix]